MDFRTTEQLDKDYVAYAIKLPEKYAIKDDLTVIWKEKRKLDYVGAIQGSHVQFNVFKC